MKPTEILKEVRKQTKQVILFHSIAGKDSIALLEMCSNIFEHVHCVYMHIVPNLEHMNRYKRFFLAQYQNISFTEYEHWALNSRIKTGYLGIKKDETVKGNTLAKVMIQAQKDLKIDWIVLGSKKSDGLARCLQLKTYEHEAINYKNTKVYPLSKWTNSKVFEFIRINDLITPLNYGTNAASSSNDPSNIFFLTWCKEHFPEDYKKIIRMFPEAEIIMYRDENQTE